MTFLATVSLLVLAAPVAMTDKRPVAVYAKGAGPLTTRLATALRAGVADSSRFRTSRRAKDDDVQLVFTAPPRALAGGRLAYAIDLMALDHAGVPVTISSLTGTCRATRMAACSSAILAKAAHGLGY